MYALCRPGVQYIKAVSGRAFIYLLKFFRDRFWILFKIHFNGFFRFMAH